MAVQLASINFIRMTNLIYSNELWNSCWKKKHSSDAKTLSCFLCAWVPECTSRIKSSYKMSAINKRCHKSIKNAQTCLWFCKEDRVMWYMFIMFLRDVQLLIMVKDIVQKHCRGIKILKTISHTNCWDDRSKKSM